jgi:predicted signal transduction protein with EAL and GGDEF domain
MDGADGETLIGNADLALHKAKRTGRGSSAFFDNTLRATHRPARSSIPGCAKLTSVAS